MSVFYTDGSCMPNPGPGGWAFVLLPNKDDSKEWHVSGGEKHSTNNRMELQAVIEALKFTQTKRNTIYSDSKYVINGITKWIGNWERKGWNKVKNEDLWKELRVLTRDKDIKWLYVKAHNGDEYNELVDKLAKKEVVKTK